MNANRKVGLFMLLALSVFIVASSTGLSYTNAAAGIYWGATLYGKPPDSSAFQSGGFIANFETYIAKKTMSIIAWGAPWEYPVGTMLPFQTTYFDNVRNHGAIPMLHWGSWACCGAIQPKYKLTNIIRGDFDAFITQWATDARNWGHPFFLRFDWEMNGNWQFPWSVQLNGNTPADYVNAWRHVRDIFNSVGATNATWVWAPNISSWNTVPMVLLYPGSAYVDWVGLDGYNWASKQNMPWMSFEQVFSGDTSLVSNSKDSYTEITTVALGKPLMITEFASIEAGDGGSKKLQWIKAGLSTIINRYPQIKAVVWFNWDDQISGLSWPVESSQASRDGFASAISMAEYLPGSFNNLANAKIPARR